MNGNASIPKTPAPERDQNKVCVDAECQIAIKQQTADVSELLSVQLQSSSLFMAQAWGLADVGQQVSASSTGNMAVLSSCIFSATDPVFIHSDNQIMLDMLPVFHCLLPLQRYSDLQPTIEEVNAVRKCISINPWWDNALNSFAQLVLTPVSGT